MQTKNQTQPITIDATDLASSDKADVIQILFVDDDNSILEISKQILMDMGNFKIDNACGVEEAYKKLKTSNYDVIVSDYEMPQKNGLDFLKELREGKNEIPFILFTGKGREEVAIKALNLGSDAYISKAGDPETVYGELSDALHKTVDRKLSKKLLAHSEQKYRRLIEDMSQGVIIVKGPPPRIVFANSAMEKMTGFSSKDLFSFSPFEISKLIHPDDRADFLNRLNQRLSGEKQESGAYEFRGIRKDGSMTWLEVCSSLIEYDGERVVQGVFLDITQRKNAEMKLIESESKYRSIFDNAEAGMFRTKLDGSEILDCNENFLKIFGRSREEVQGNPSLVHWADSLQRQEMLRLLRVNGRVNGFECKLLDKQGNIRTCIGSIKLYPEQGILEGSVIDITERKMAEEALKESEERFSTLSSAAFEGIVISRDGRILDANNQIAKMFGFELSDIIGKNVSDFVAPESQDLVKANMDKGFEGPYEHLAVNREGSVFPVEVRARFFYHKGRSARVSIIRDITERKKTVEELKQSEFRFRSLYESSFDAVLLTKPDGVILSANPAACRMFNMTEGEIVRAGRNGLVIDDESSLSAVEERAKFGKAKSELTFKRKDGSTFEGETTSSLFTDSDGTVKTSMIIREITERKKAEEELENAKNYFKTLMTSVLSGIIVVDSETHEIIDANPAALSLIGASEKEVLGKVCHKFICPAEIEKCPITDLGQKLDKAEKIIITSNGEHRPIIKSVVQTRHNGKTLLVENFVDISTLKKIENNLQNNQKHFELMNEKLRVVGGLTRHDVRNKLSAVNCYAYLIKKRHSDQLDIVNDIDKMGQSIKEIERIFDFAKTYEKLGVEDLVFVNVGNVLNEAKALFSCQLPEIVNNCYSIDVLADSFLRQMFYNFIDNTRKYGKTTTTIKAYFEESDDNLKLIYEDDGVGISAENKPMLFKEGFSTEGSTGFGLFLCKKMIEVYGWEIEEIGEPGKGAKFKITIPKKRKDGKDNYIIQ